MEIRARAQAEIISEMITRAIIKSRIAAVRWVSICMMLRLIYQPNAASPEKHNHCGSPKSDVPSIDSDTHESDPDLLLLKPCAV